MNKFTLFCLLFLSIFISCKEEKASTKVKKEKVEVAKKKIEATKVGFPQISFDRTEYDFGTVNEGEVVEGTFSITNTGESDLLITKASPSCGCTVPEYPKEPIAPGASSHLKFSFNTRGRTNAQNKSISIHTNTERGVEVIRIKGMVTPSKQ